MKPIINHAVIVYDGDCIFCSRSMAWVARHDDMDLVRFTPCTSPLGRSLMEERGIDPADPSTFLLILEGRAYVRSEAMLRVVALLDRPARTLRVMRLVPRPLRDAVYDAVARSRKRIMRGECPVPTREFQSRLIR